MYTDSLQLLVTPGFKCIQNELLQLAPGSKKVYKNAAAG